MPSLPSVNRILPHLYLGNAAAAEDATFLTAANIKRIVTVNAIAIRKTNLAHIKYLLIPCEDTPSQLILRWLSEFLSFIHHPTNESTHHTPSSLLDETESKCCFEAVLVHCARGISRSATFVIAYLMTHFSLSFEAAFKFVERKRKIYPNVGFYIQLKCLDKELMKRRDPIVLTLEPEDAKKLEVAKRSNASLDEIREIEDLVYVKKILEIRQISDINDVIKSCEMECCSEEWLYTEVERYVYSSLMEIKQLVSKAQANTTLLRLKGLWLQYLTLFDSLRIYNVTLPNTVIEAAREAIRELNILKVLFAADIRGVKGSQSLCHEIQRWMTNSIQLSANKEMNASTPDVMANDKLLENDLKESQQISGIKVNDRNKESKKHHKHRKKHKHKHKKSKKGRK